MHESIRIEAIRVAVGFKNKGWIAVPADDHLEFVAQRCDANLGEIATVIQEAVKKHWDGSLERFEWVCEPRAKRVRVKVYLG